MGCDKEKISLEFPGCLPKACCVTGASVDCAQNPPVLTIEQVNERGEDVSVSTPLCLERDWTIDKDNVTTVVDAENGIFDVTIPCIDRASGDPVGEFTISFGQLFDDTFSVFTQDPATGIITQTLSPNIAHVVSGDGGNAANLLTVGPDGGALLECDRIGACVTNNVNGVAQVGGEDINITDSDPDNLLTDDGGGSKLVCSAIGGCVTPNTNGTAMVGGANIDITDSDGDNILSDDGGGSKLTCLDIGNCVTANLNGTASVGGVAINITDSDADNILSDDGGGSKLTCANIGSCVTGNNNGTGSVGGVTLNITDSDGDNILTDDGGGSKLTCADIGGCTTANVNGAASVGGVTLNITDSDGDNILTDDGGGTKLTCADVVGCFSAGTNVTFDVQPDGSVIINAGTTPDILSQDPGTGLITHIPINAGPPTQAHVISGDGADATNAIQVGADGGAYLSCAQIQACVGAIPVIPDLTRTIVDDCGGSPNNPWFVSNLTVSGHAITVTRRRDHDSLKAVIRLPQLNYGAIVGNMPPIADIREGVVPSAAFRDTTFSNPNPCRPMEAIVFITGSYAGDIPANGGIGGFYAIGHSLYINGALIPDRDGRNNPGFNTAISKMLSSLGGDITRGLQDSDLSTIFYPVTIPAGGSVTVGADFGFSPTFPPFNLLPTTVAIESRQIGIIGRTV